MAIIISDNATSIVGAAKELNAFTDEWDKATSEVDLAQKKIVWKIITSGALHFDEIWEILVKSCKKVNTILDCEASQMRSSVRKCVL